MTWLASLLSRGGPQTKKLAYLAVITASLVWLSVGLKVEIKREWNVAFGLLLAAVTTGYVGGKKVGASASPATSGASSAIASDVSAAGSAKIVYPERS